MMVVRSTAARVAETAPADFRLRSFVERLVSLGEVDIVDDNVDLVDVAARLDGNPKAVLFRSVGPEKSQLVGNVVGSRARLAAGFGVSEKDLLAEVLRRLERPIDPVEVAQADAPVQEVVLTGDDADFTKGAL